eukprot:GHVR01067663.1.p1 GENE.GHVR01067663.1~~GHVR01067663.1.p1  ORF type:complete len:130 (-),score=12.02 GHVR01067663.1:782-1171(-)
MQTANVWKLCKDHTLNEFVSIREVQSLVYKVNNRLKNELKDSSLLDFDAFEEFIIQVSMVMFSRPPKDLRGYPISKMVEEVFFRFKLYASENKIDERLFEDMESVAYSDTEIIQNLNENLRENQDYILP